jgi:hypothetical protein
MLELPGWEMLNVSPWTCSHCSKPVHIVVNFRGHITSRILFWSAPLLVRGVIHKVLTRYSHLTACCSNWKRKNKLQRSDSFETCVMSFRLLILCCHHHRHHHNHHYYHLPFYYSTSYMLSITYDSKQTEIMKIRITKNYEQERHERNKMTNILALNFAGQ